MSTSMYDRVRRDKPKKRRDPKFIITLIVTLALIIGFCVWVWSWNHSRELFWEFTSELSSATVSANNSGGVKANISGEAIDVTVDELYSVYGKLTASRQIRHSDDVPQGDAIAIYYPDGSSLKIWETTFDVRGWTRNTGVFVEFTDPQGEVFSFITDRVQYYDIYNTVN